MVYMQGGGHIDDIYEVRNTDESDGTPDVPDDAKPPPPAPPGDGTASNNVQDVPEEG